MMPAARTRMLSHLQAFFRDLQERGWITARFSPERIFQTLRSLTAQIGPQPRIVADDLWCKLLHAGQNLRETDLPRCAAYPLFLPIRHGQGAQHTVVVRRFEA